MARSLTPQMAAARPRTSGQYLTASALYRAGFRGWPLVIETAIAGPASGWNPHAFNNNPNTGDYSVGLFQMNYFGGLLPGRTKEYGSPSLLLSSPQAQADAEYLLVGGNTLAGLSAHGQTASPAEGVIPLSGGGGHSLNPYIPSAAAAAAEVGEFGPASVEQIAQGSTWPGASPLGSALSGGNNPPAQTAATAAALNAATASNCSSKGNVFGTGGIFGIGSFKFTHCELKALIGTASFVAGGILVVVGLSTIIIGGLSSKGPLGQVVGVAGTVARVGTSPVRSITRRRSPFVLPRPREGTETQRQKEDRVWSEMQSEKAAKEA
jgi:hypothetical protein